jgi:hypothetical protein
MIIRARNVYGEPLPKPCDIWLEDLGHSARRRRRVARDVPPSGRAKFSTAWQTSYRVRVVCEGHAEVARNVGGSVAEVELAVPVDPSAVVGFQWPDPMPEIPGIVWHEPPFSRLYPTNVWHGGSSDDCRRATALNIWAKLWAVSIGMAPAAVYVEEVLEVHVDRMICRMAPGILDAFDAAWRAGTVDLVTSAVGHDPPDGYENGPSIKTLDDTGNLQVSIFRPTGHSDGPLLADIDIDEERGFPHALRAVGHALTGGKTDAVEVQQILAAQGIDALWRPILA